MTAAGTLVDLAFWVTESIAIVWSTGTIQGILDPRPGRSMLLDFGKFFRFSFTPTAERSGIEIVVVDVRFATITGLGGHSKEIA